jgi:TatD DNase family protein
MTYFNLHTHSHSDQPDVTTVVNQYPWDFIPQIPVYSIGIHPWYIDENRLESDIKKLKEKLTLNECIALGECGLDKRIEIPLAIQIKVFETQIKWAEYYKKPLILHIVAAFQELSEIMTRLQPTIPIILHGFSKNTQVANQMLHLGCYLSFGKYLLKNPELKSTFKAVPLDRIFLETDTESNTIQEVYEVAAAYKEITVTQLKKQIEANFHTVFRNR